MTTAEEIEAARNAIVQAHTAVSAAFDSAAEAVALVVPVLDAYLADIAPPPPPPPPPADRPANVVATPLAGAVRLTWEHPDPAPSGLVAVFMAYGSDTAGYLGQTSLPPAAVEHTVTGLTAGISHAFDIAYNVGTPIDPATFVRVTATPLSQPAGSTDPGLFPATAGWPDKMAWIESRAGLKPSAPARKPIAGNVPDGCTWDGRTLHIYNCPKLENLDIPGRIYVRPETLPFTIRNVRGEDVFGAERVTLVEDCEFTMPAHRVMASGERWGQGNLNALADGFVIRRTLLRGAADNIQCSPSGAAGLIEECVLRDMTIDPTWTHNDFIQNYGGRVNIRRSLLRQDLGPNMGGHVNGLFGDGGTYDLEDSAVIVTAPAGTNAWALHAGKHSTSRQIVARRCYVRGRYVEKLADSIVFEADVDYLAGY